MWWFLRIKTILINMRINEYDISYIVKEFLIKKGWKIVAFNPPGAQGTFTIPNPEKDSTYKGQTGSLSPDIVAFRVNKDRNEILIIESKPLYSKKDVDKMIGMLKNTIKERIFFTLIKGCLEANSVLYKKNEDFIINFAKAHSGDKNLIEGLSTFHVNLLDEKWNPRIIDPKEDIYRKFKVELL